MTLLLYLVGDATTILPFGSWILKLSSSYFGFRWLVCCSAFLSTSLLIIVSCEYSPGLLVCIKLAASLQSGLIDSMRFRSGRPSALSWVVPRRSKFADIYTDFLGCYSDLAECHLLLTFFLALFFALFETTRLFLSVFCLFSKDNTNPCGCVRWFSPIFL